MKRRMSQWIFISIIVVLSLATLFITGAQHSVVAADTEGNRIKVVKRVLVNDGDTLWDIALHYYSSEYKSVEDYIAEIKRSNGTSSDLIYAGQYIILPYYVSAEIKS